jgi:O-antigen/teichoic acid export membrane protein
MLLEEGRLKDNEKRQAEIRGRFLHRPQGFIHTDCLVRCSLAGLGEAINVVTKLAAVAILARLISPSEFGMFAAAGLLVSLASTLSEETFALPLVQRETITPSHVQSVFWISAGTSMLMMGLVVLTAPSAERFFGFDGLHLIVLGLAPVLVFKAIASVGMATLRRAHRFATITIAVVTAQVAGYVIPAIVLAVQGFGIWSLVCGQVLASVLEALLACLLGRCPMRLALDIAAVKQSLRLGGFLTVARLANWLALQVDNIVVGRVLGAEALGLYIRSNLLAVATQVQTAAKAGSYLIEDWEGRTCDDRRA